MHVIMIHVVQIVYVWCITVFYTVHVVHRTCILYFSKLHFFKLIVFFFLVKWSHNVKSLPFRLVISGKAAFIVKALV